MEKGGYFIIFLSGYLQGPLTNTLLKLSPSFFMKYLVIVQSYWFFENYCVIFYHIPNLNSRFLVIWIGNQMNKILWKNYTLTLYIVEQCVDKVDP
jgi:hypothetical protein